MKLKKHIILFSLFSLLLLPKKTTQACGFIVAPGEYRFWLLQPDLVNEEDLTPFYFASTYLYKGDMYAGNQTFPYQNIKEWYKEINGSASEDDIDILLNDTPPKDFFEAKPDVKSNAFFKYLNKPSNKELLRYFVLSKKTEEIAAYKDPWAENIFPQPAITAVIKEVALLNKEAKSPFVKLRTAYQLTRLYSYNHQYDLVVKTYDSLIAGIKTMSCIKPAALYQKAINSPGLQENYYLSKVFDENYNRTACLVGFDSKEYEGTLSLAKNKHERTVIYAMKVFNYRGRSLQFIQSIYSKEPSYKELDFLLLREINKIEDWLVTNKVTDFGYPAAYPGIGWPEDYRDDALKNYTSDQKYASEVLQFMLQVIHERKTSGKPLMNLMAAHLAMLKKDYQLSASLLNNAAKEKNIPVNIKTQIQINRYLLALEKGFDKNAEDQFMNIILSTNKKLGLYDADIMKDQLVLYTARKLINSGNKAKGVMLLSKTRRALGKLPIGTYKTVYQFIEQYADAKAYDEILNILNSKSKTPFEKFVADKKFRTSFDYYEYALHDSAYYDYWSINKVLDCKASYYIRNHNLRSALQTMKQIPDSFYNKDPYKEYIGGNPFYVNVYNISKEAPGNNINLNKKQVVARMIRLQEIAEADKTKSAMCYFQLANAWYNLTYYGKDWLMVKQWKSSSELSYYDHDFKQSAFNDEYYGCAYAKSFYMKAIQFTKDKKLNALCNFMAGVCERNNLLYAVSLKNKDNYAYDYKQPADFNTILQRKGINTKYYQQIVQECELYQSYINGYNRKL